MALPGRTCWRSAHPASTGRCEKLANVFIRSGLAFATQTKNKIEIHFRENDFPESKPIFIGKILKNKINGKLKSFFMYEEDLELFGHIRFKQFDKNCAFEEVVLQTKELTGSIFILNRYVGNC